MQAAAFIRGLVHEPFDTPDSGSLRRAVMHGVAARLAIAAR
jgi:hypothetical protein